ncbi:TetR/AcrR family transcriptional regulator [Anaerotignum sp.]|nr:TetR/AcrR family transcriptional regulator [Anaerotignum sp.]MBQ7758098.1 TetR/AcrR family transcriptional regulator [Anaerotignum sp.]
MKTENEILEMAFAMFLEKGFSEISTNELIRAAGLTKGGFYYSFKSREDLDQRVIERYIHPFFSQPLEEMEKMWEASKKDAPTGKLLWYGFFQPQRFSNYQEKIGKKIAFRNFYFLIYEGMKKFPEVAEYYKDFNARKGQILKRILERGQIRGEITKNIDLENYITMILAMQDGILALKVLDDDIDDEEKYEKIQYQMWKDISTEEIKNYMDGGVTSAVS